MHAVVTGGTGAIGLSICQYLQAQGLLVSALCHPQEQLSASASSLQQAGLLIQPVNVADFEATQAVFEALIEQVGPVTVLVNAAGITADQPLKRMTPSQWQQVIATNLDSVFNCCKAVEEGMRQGGFGRIINVSSVNGQRGQFGQCNYAAAKAGMHGFTMSLARELARHQVTVNTVAPGYIQSPMIERVPSTVRQQIVEQIPAGQFGKPEDVASVVAFLALPENGYITGTEIAVNGGLHMQ